MRYQNVFVEALSYELPPVVVTSSELEMQLKAMYKALHIPLGQLETLTGIGERRWWEKGYLLSDGATSAAQKALENSPFKGKDIEALVYTGVCRENFEPATACRVAAKLGLKEDAFVYDISNACLGVLNGIIDIANRIELGQIEVGMVVSSETAREINETMIARMLKETNIEAFKYSLATLTGGSGSVAVLLTNQQRSSGRRRLLGGTAKAAPQHYQLCKWGMELVGDSYTPTMFTDSVAVLKNGVELAQKTWRKFLEEINWQPHSVDKVICHQIGSEHQNTVLKALSIERDKDFCTYPYLGNIGTVSLPITAAIAEERDFIEPGDRVGFLGIGSGLNCIMLGWEW
ncbi:3-oxoacyl-ACP synthase III [Candidatus Uabimicrobium sp. HlEnr_7]|uniref:3-oxoacyl-ACP synthase III n=1 Tax=Candidatus Uabimicrobium helgolandensis TaxID=3095367 RepID=UPI003558EB0F